MIEILQTIWSSLTTENEVLVNFLLIPLSFIEVYVSVLLFTTLLNINTTSKQRIIYSLVLGLFSVISDIFISSPVDAILNAILFFTCTIIIFKANAFKSLLAIIVPFIITIVLELILASIYNVIFNTNYADTTNIPINRLFFSLIIYLIEFLFYIFIKKLKVNFTNIRIMDKKSKILLIITNVLAIALIACQLYILTFYYSNMPIFITALNILGMITYFILNLYTVSTKSKLETTTMNLEEAKEYNKTLELLQDNARAYRHDRANILQGMIGYIDNKDIDGLKKYYTQLVGEFQAYNNLTTLSPKVVNNPAVYSVLASKYHKADGLGIKINLEAFLDMNTLNMKVFEFTRILGILMDNAIEASKECEEKVINVTIRKNNKKNMQLLIVDNTYKDKNIDTDKIFEKGYSTKEGNTGLGLWEIRKILKKNNNLNLYTTKNDKFFTQQLEIYCK